MLEAVEIDWSRPGAWGQLVSCVGRATTHFAVAHAVVEALGPTRGKARGFASSWATMSECTGRVLQELDRAGIQVDRATPGEWRGRLGLPGAFGEGAAKDRTAKWHALELLGYAAPSGHVAEAALMAMSCPS